MRFSCLFYCNNHRAIYFQGAGIFKELGSNLSSFVRIWFSNFSLFTSGGVPISPRPHHPILLFHSILFAKSDFVCTFKLTTDAFQGHFWLKAEIRKVSGSMLEYFRRQNNLGSTRNYLRDLGRFRYYFQGAYENWPRPHPPPPPPSPPSLSAPQPSASK